MKVKLAIQARYALTVVDTNVLLSAACWADIPAELAQRTFSRDAQDDIFIHVALAARATRLITGDDDLLCLDPLEGLRIVTPRAALGELLAESP